MEVEHFSHPDHPLILINQVLEYRGELVICSGCDEPIWGPCYSCTSCYLFLHKNVPSCPVRSSCRFVLFTLFIYWQSHHHVIPRNAFVICALKLARVSFTIVLSANLISMSNVLFNGVLLKLIVRHINLPT